MVEWQINEQKDEGTGEWGKITKNFRSNRLVFSCIPWELFFFLLEHLAIELTDESQDSWWHKTCL